MTANLISYLKKQCLNSAAIAVTILGVSAGIFAAVPANDNFADAQVLTGIQVHIQANNIDATKESGEPNHAGNSGGRSVWFKWTAPMSRTMAFTTNRSAGNLDTLLHIYKGTGFGNFTSLALSNDINGIADRRSFTRLTVTQGQTYYIAIDGFADGGQPATQGDFALDIQPSFNFQGSDLDSDGMTDLSLYRPSTGVWYTLVTSDQQTRTKRWGAPGDIPLVYSGSGSGANEQNVFRPSDGTWYINACCQNSYIPWGMSGDIPVLDTFGGGTNTDPAVFRPSDGTWYFWAFNGNFKSYRFGAAGDIPVPGNYSPDPFADVAVFRPSTGVWYILQRISNNSSFDSYRYVKFGQQGDKPVPADYDGDGVLDIAVFRPSTGVWYVQRSSDSQVQTFQWGSENDIPTTGDYDGDGKFDYAVYRPATGVWYVMRSGDGAAYIRQFGVSEDIPVTANKTF